MPQNPGGEVQDQDPTPHVLPRPSAFLSPGSRSRNAEAAAGLKRCPVCERDLPLDSYASDRSRKDGLMLRCRECDSIRNQQYYAANRAAILARKSAANAARARPAKRTGVCGCGQPTPSRRHTYCTACGFNRKKARERRRERERWGRRPSTTEAGYGHEHQKLRKRWAPIVAAGRVRCARCDEIIWPGTPWDLGHDDHDRSRYVGPEHRGCNRATAGRRADTPRSSTPLRRVEP